MNKDARRSGGSVPVELDYPTECALTTSHFVGQCDVFWRMLLFIALLYLLHEQWWAAAVSALGTWLFYWKYNKQRRRLNHQRRQLATARGREGSVL